MNEARDILRISVQRAWLTLDRAYRWIIWRLSLVRISSWLKDVRFEVFEMYILLVHSITIIYQTLCTVVCQIYAIQHHGSRKFLQKWIWTVHNHKNKVFWDTMYAAAHNWALVFKTVISCTLHKKIDLSWCALHHQSYIVQKLLQLTFSLLKFS